MRRGRVPPLGGVTLIEIFAAPVAIRPNPLNGMAACDARTVTPVPPSAALFPVMKELVGAGVRTTQFCPDVVGVTVSVIGASFVSTSSTRTLREMASTCACRIPDTIASAEARVREFEIHSIKFGMLSTAMVETITRVTASSMSEKPEWPR